MMNPACALILIAGVWINPCNTDAVFKSDWNSNNCIIIQEGHAVNLNDTDCKMVADIINKELKK